VRPRLLSHPLASLAEVEATEVRVAKAARVTDRLTGAALCRVLVEAVVMRWFKFMRIEHYE